MVLNNNRIVVALGGNALQANPKDASAKTQLATVKETAKPIVDLIEDGHELIITHGNGPQVGQIIATYESAASSNKDMSIMPFPECNAMSQGYIGYHIQQAIKEELLARNIKKSVATVITQVVVDEKDKAFQNPTKPIGSFFTKEEAEALTSRNGYIMKEDAGRGYRRVVASPEPVDIVESEVVKTLVTAGHVVITVGGGGIPVVVQNNTLRGVPAVIDKDFASGKIAEISDADCLILLTTVESVALNFNTPAQRELKKLTVKEALQYVKEGHFAPGSMLPKVEAAIKFVQSKPGRVTLIMSLKKIKEGIEGKTGTLFVG